MSDGTVPARTQVDAEECPRPGPCGPRFPPLRVPAIRFSLGAQPKQDPNGVFADHGFRDQREDTEIPDADSAKPSRIPHRKTYSRIRECHDPGPGPRPLTLYRLPNGQARCVIPHRPSHHRTALSRLLRLSGSVSCFHGHLCATPSIVFMSVRCLLLTQAVVLPPHLFVNYDKPGRANFDSGRICVDTE